MNNTAAIIFGAVAAAVLVWALHTMYSDYTHAKTEYTAECHALGREVVRGQCDEN